MTIDKTNADDTISDIVFDALVDIIEFAPPLPDRIEDMGSHWDFLCEEMKRRDAWLLALTNQELGEIAKSW